MTYDLKSVFDTSIGQAITGYITGELARIPLDRRCRKVIELFKKAGISEEDVRFSFVNNVRLMHEFQTKKNFQKTLGAATQKNNDLSYVKNMDFSEWQTLKTLFPEHR